MKVLRERGVGFKPCGNGKILIWMFKPGMSEDTLLPVSGIPASGSSKTIEENERSTYCL